MVDNVTVQDGDDSTIPSLDENAINDTNPDGSFDDAFEAAFNGVLDNVEAVAPSEVEEEVEELEVSEDTEQSPSDDDEDSDIDTEEDDEEIEEVGEEDAVVGFDEMKNFKFEFDGNHYSANDLKSAIGQLKKQEEARSEVEAVKAEVERERKELESYKAQVQSQHTLTAGAQQLSQMENMYKNLAEERAKALEGKDSHNLTLINTRIDELRMQYEKVQSEVQQAQNQQAYDAAQALDRFGFGELNTDSQRQAAFRDYAFANIPEGLISVINTNPELIAIVEKARLHDKSKKATPKAKLKGSKKTLKGGAAKATPKKTVDPLEEAFFNATSDMEFRS